MSQSISTIPSAPESPTIQTLRQWCETVDNTCLMRKATRSTLLDQADTLALLRENLVRPDELDDTEWGALKEKLLEAQDKMRVPKGAIATPQDKRAALDATDLVWPRIRLVEGRASAFGKIEGARIDAMGFSAEGIGRLRRLDDPEAALPAAEELRARLREAEEAADTVGDYLTPGLRGALAGCRASLAALELDEAERRITAYERAIGGLVAEARAVAELTWKVLPFMWTKAKPNDLAQKRELAAVMRRWQAVQAGLEGFEKSRKADGELPQDKRQQIEAVHANLKTAIAEWYHKDTFDALLTTQTTVGALYWAEDTLKNLFARSVTEARQEARKARENAEWKAFEDDVVRCWTIFEKNRFSIQHRGHDAPKDLLTPSVRERMDKIGIGGRLKIRGENYTKEYSYTTTFALHRPYPKPEGRYPRNMNGAEVRSFTYHLY